MLRVVEAPTAPHDDVEEFTTVLSRRLNGAASTERHAAEGRARIPEEFFKVFGALAAKAFPRSSQSEVVYSNYARELVRGMQKVTTGAPHSGQVVAGTSWKPETMLLAFHLLRRLDAAPHKPAQLTARRAISVALMLAGSLQADISPTMETWTAIESKAAWNLGWGSYTSDAFADYRLAFASALSFDLGSPPPEVMVERAVELDEFMRAVRAESDIQWSRPPRVGPGQHPAPGGVTLEMFIDRLTSSVTAARVQGGPVGDPMHDIPHEFFDVFADLALMIHHDPSDERSAHVNYVRSVVHMMYLSEVRDPHVSEYTHGRPLTLLLAFDFLSRVAAAGTEVGDGGGVKVGNLNPSRAAFAALMLAWKFQNDGAIPLTTMREVEKESSRYASWNALKKEDIAESELQFFKALRYNVAPVPDALFMRACALGTAMRRQAEKHHSRARASG